MAAVSARRQASDRLARDRIEEHELRLPRLLRPREDLFEKVAGGRRGSHAAASAALFEHVVEGSLSHPVRCVEHHLPSIHAWRSYQALLQVLLRRLQLTAYELPRRMLQRLAWLVPGGWRRVSVVHRASLIHGRPRAPPLMAGTPAHRRAQPATGMQEAGRGVHTCMLPHAAGSGGLGGAPQRCALSRPRAHTCALLAGTGLAHASVLQVPLAYPSTTAWQSR